MLWSPSEVLAYMKDDSKKLENQKASSLVPTSAFGGFKTWPQNQIDFILIAENSEIHGPNPIFTIPEVDPGFDLNTFSTQILSADYQGLGNSKLLPGKNAQLLLPDISQDVHVAAHYFFLFDSEARGFVRPTCLAFVTSDKHKLLMFSEKILNQLSETAEIMQHANICYHIKDLRELRDSLKPTSQNDSLTSKEIFIEARFKDVQEIIDVAESYQGNDLISKQLVNITEILKNSKAHHELQKQRISSTSENANPSEKLKITSMKKCMKSLYQICHNGLILALYNLHVTYKFFRRKVETIIVVDNCTKLSKGKNTTNSLHFGACIKSNRLDNLYQNKCLLHSFKVPALVSMQFDNYFHLLDDSFQKLLIRYANCENKDMKTDDTSDCPTDLSSINSSPSTSSKDNGFSNNQFAVYGCRHVSTLGQLWDLLQFLQSFNPGIEFSFLKVLKLFDDTQRFLFALLTRVPIVVISTSQELQTAQDFIKALSVFIPCKKNEIVFVDYHCLVPLRKALLSEVIAVHFCLDNNSLEDFIPMELLPSLCVLNLKDCSLTAPTYNGCLLKNVDLRIRSIQSEKCIFPIFLSILSEIERTIEWWQMVTSSKTDINTASQYVLSRGYNRHDMKIIETLSRLRKD